MKRLLLAASALTVLGLAGLIAMPSPIDPDAWTPPEAPSLSGDWEPNDRLQKVDLLGTGAFNGPEDVDADREGRVYAGSRDGKITRVLPDGRTELFADTGGRPLGMDFDPQGNLIVCDSYKGLLSIAPDGRIKVLLTRVDGIALKFADDVEVARDGWIYFSDASIKFGQTEYMLDMLEARPWGRLIRHHPASGRTQTLLTDLYFANGVALSKRNDFVLVNETYRYRITRYWLSGPKKGTSDTFADNLAGFPDGISQSGRGTFWVAMPTVRNPDADAMHPHPWVKALLAKLPEALWPQPKRYGLVAEMDEKGKLLRTLQDTDGDPLWLISSVQERHGKVYFGTLEGTAVGRLAP